MQQWEYKIDDLWYIDSHKVEELNRAGREGWELVGIYHEGSSAYAVFKRPVL